MLCMELANNDKPPELRKLAGLILKNALTAKVTISIGVGGETPSQVICRLNAGEAIFFPEPVNAQFSLSDNGVAAAVEVAVFT